MTYRPWLKEDGMPRYFGVEMELTSMKADGTRLTGEEIKQGLRNARVPRLNRRAPGYYHSNGETWDVKTDSSCGWEVASPKLELNADGDCDQLSRACVGLTSVGPVINRSCGLHVHVDVSDFDWRDFQRLIALWARYEPFFFEITPPSRRNNTYCGPVRATSWAALSQSDLRARSGLHNPWPNTERVLAATNQAAFQSALTGMPRGSLNVAGFVRRGTVEFRLQGGTVNYLKIRNWAIMLMALVNRAKLSAAPPVPLTINQPRPELGFGVRYVFQVIGLAPNRWAPVVAPVCAQVETWAVERRRAFVGVDPAITF